MYYCILSSILDVERKESQAWFLSLDFFKAYDRVQLDFVMKVMESMNFGDLGSKCNMRVLVPDSFYRG